MKMEGPIQTHGEVRQQKIATGSLHEIEIADANVGAKEVVQASDAIDARVGNDSNDGRRALLRHKQSSGGGKRKRSHQKGNTKEELYNFQCSPHRLRIPASSVAALCGLHPFQNLPQMMFDFVYQSHLGQLLLNRDAIALGLTLVDAKTHEAESMLNLASAASEETKQLVKQALEVSEGKRTLRSVEEVQNIQKRIRAQASRAQEKGKLSKRQAESLVEASRGHVSTGFGTCHEDEALDIYEKRTGCSVRERNEALMEWRFMRLNDVDGELGVTAAPMGEAKRRVWEQRNVQVLNNDKREESAKAKQKDGTNSQPIEINDEGDSDSNENMDHDTNSKSLTKAEYPIGTSAAPASMESMPFFRIVGAVDGIRDELYMDSSNTPAPENSTSILPPNTASTASANSAGTPEKVNNTINQHSNTQSEFDLDDEDQWSLRPIIVECKHRMKEAKVPPPLYDQIQTCIYCRMYNVEEADLIQVVRRKRKGEEKENKAPKIYRGDDNGGSKGKIQSNARNREEIKITTTRVSLNDPIHDHNRHWKQTLLPRISSFVDAVYNVRKDDGKRYRLLMATVRSQQEESTNDAEEDVWKVLWEECPWLMHCDTSFGRRSMF